MILITGSAGKTGRSVLQALIERDVSVRALIHRPDQVPVIESLGAQETLIGDVRSQEVVQRSVQGVRAVYHIPPNMSPDERTIGKAMIASAQSAGVEHFVYHSVLKPQIEAMPHHWNKMLVEEQLIESCMPYTILQPAAYMQNILAHWDSILHKGIYPVPYPVDTRLSLVDLVDVAQAAASVLTEPGHQFATYELVGISSMPQTEVADILSQELKRLVKASSVPVDQWAEGARIAGLGGYQIDTLVKMFKYYQEFGFEGNTKILTWLLGRPPGTLQEFISRSREEKQLMNKISVN